MYVFRTQVLRFYGNFKVYSGKEPSLLDPEGCGSALQYRLDTILL